LGFYDQNKKEAKKEACFHHWVDAKNAVIESGRYCTKCHAIAPDA
ncbi:unnamed protein product, partial [marine sediment metagenome]